MSSALGQYYYSSNDKIEKDQDDIQSGKASSWYAGRLGISLGVVGIIGVAVLLRFYWTEAEEEKPSSGDDTEAEATIAEGTE